MHENRLTMLTFKWKIHYKTLQKEKYYYMNVGTVALLQIGLFYVLFYKPSVYFQTLVVCRSKYRFIAKEKVITHISIGKIGWLPWWYWLHLIFGFCMQSLLSLCFLTFEHYKNQPIQQRWLAWFQLRPKWDFSAHFREI